jgi:hypothetical protein
LEVWKHAGASSPLRGRPHDQKGERTVENNNDLERVKMLFDYTKFHIGLYTSVNAVVIAAMHQSYIHHGVPQILAITAVIFVAFSGLCGGVVASSLPHLLGTSEDLSPAADTLYDRHIGPLCFDKEGSRFSARVRTWTYLEHSAFWIGVVLVLIAALMSG